mgnify:FL=1
MQDLITRALIELAPNSSFAVKGDTYADIVWKNSEITKPTETEVNNKIAELQNAEPMRLLRIERDQRLASCDWRVIMAKETGSNIPAAWKTYRQALRDLPASASPKLNSNGDLDFSSVTWPTQP